MLPPIFPKSRMSDERWTAKDKITQYKGLVKLFERDAQILQADRHIHEKKQMREFRQLKKDIAIHRQELDNAVKGDQQLCGTILNRNKSLKRTFQNHLPEKTLEYLEHKNFNKRKLLDRLQYKSKNKVKELITHKLTHAELQKNRTSVPEEVKEKRICETIAGKLQEVNIKLEAGVQIKYIYKQILDILQKDKLHFDYMLSQLMADASDQSKCIYQATQVGQLAIEYTDDRKQELEELQRAVKRDMKSRLLQLRITERQVENLQDTLKSLVRKESTVEIAGRTADMVDNQLQHDLQNVKKILTLIQNRTNTSKFEEIIPWLQDGKSRNNKMKSLLKKHVNEKEVLVNKINHAKSMHCHLINTTECSAFSYMGEKVTLKQNLEAASKKAQKLKNTLDEKSNMAARIQSALFHLKELCRIVNTNPNRTKQHSDTANSEIIYAPKQLEMDGLKILADLETQLHVLIHALDQDEIENIAQPDIKVERCFEKFISQISRKVYMDEHIQDELLLEVEYNDPHIITREQIKKNSQHLVEQNAKPDWML